MIFTKYIHEKFNFLQIFKGLYQLEKLFNDQNFCLLCEMNLTMFSENTIREKSESKVYLCVYIFNIENTLLTQCELRAYSFEVLLSVRM